MASTYQINENITKNIRIEGAKINHTSREARASYEEMISFRNPTVESSFRSQI